MPDDGPGATAEQKESKSGITAAEPIVTTGSTELSEFAPAKINLTLRIGRKRPDGYHELESLVVFADVGDDVACSLPGRCGLAVRNRRDGDAGRSGSDDNLVLKAARALQAQIADLRIGHFHLTKRLPVAAGIGGGSSDAAAALRLLARLNDLPANDEPADRRRARNRRRRAGLSRSAAADHARHRRDLVRRRCALPPLHAVLVNPGVPVPTGAVFAALAKSRANAAPPRSMTIRCRSA